MSRWMWMATVLGVVATGTGVRADDDASTALFPVTVFDGAAAGAKLPTSDNAQVLASTAVGKPAVVIGLPSAGWGRAWWNDLPRDLRPFAHVDIELRTVSGTPAPLELTFGNGGTVGLRLALPAPTEAWEKRRLDLGDFNPDPGFDPAQVTSLTLVWGDPKGTSVAVANVTLVPGAGGWRHTLMEQMKRVYGPQRARTVKQASTKHFEVFSDGPKSVAALGAALEKDAEAIVFHMGAPKEALDGLKLPVYAFKSAEDYRAYVVRALGLSEALARVHPAMGASWGMVMIAQEGGNPVWRHRLALTLLRHLYSWGGGAWLHDGAAEYCVRRMSGRPVSKDMAARVKTGDHWKLAELLGATALYPTAPEAAGTYDYRPTFLHAASVVEYLLRVPPAEPAALSPSERIQARLKAMTKVGEQGWARIEALQRVMGVGTVDEFEAAWKAFVAAAK